MDPAMAKEWISMIEKIFEFIQIEDEDKVKCTMYMLKKDARIQWDVIKQTWDVVVMAWAEFLIEFNSKYYSEVVINNKEVGFTRLQQESMSVLEYVRQFDQLLRYASDMVQTEMSKVQRFLSRLSPGLARLVDTRRDGLELYVDAVRRTIRQESWIKTEKNVNMGTGEGVKETIQQSPLQVYGSQRSGRRLGLQSRKPNNQDKTDELGGKPQTNGRRKNGLGNQGRLEQFRGSKQGRWNFEQ